MDHGTNNAQNRISSPSIQTNDFSTANKEFIPLSIQNSGSKTWSDGFFLEKNFAGYNVTCALMIFLCSLTVGVSISKMVNDPTEENLYTIGFVVYNFLYILTCVLAILNSKRKKFEIQVIITKAFWVLLLGGTFVNIGLLRNFPEKEHHLFYVFTFLAMIYVSMTMFLVTRANKLKSKMLKTGYLNLPQL